ncbi:hypothetical protein KKF61_07135 [Patescibacteria group bacterium]|nr:hypothetical protein [Patescibacteria group bacterium]
MDKTEIKIHEAKDGNIVCVVDFTYGCSCFGRFDYVCCHKQENKKYKGSIFISSKTPVSELGKIAKRIFKCKAKKDLVLELIRIESEH